jgi:DNA repair photolyase
MANFFSNLLATLLGVLSAAIISFLLWKKQQKTIKEADYNFVRHGIKQELEINLDNLKQVKSWFERTGERFSTQDNMDLSFFESTVNSGKLSGFYEVLQKKKKIDKIEKMKNIYCDLRTFNHRFRKYSDYLVSDQYPPERLKKNIYSDVNSYIKNIEEFLRDF